MQAPLKILYKFPSRGRPERFFQSLDSIVNNTVDKENYHVSATLDKDDDFMNNEAVKNRLTEYKNVSVAWGHSLSKIDAVNRDMPKYDFDILVNMSDDMIFNIYGHDEMIRLEMAHHFPDLFGLLHFPDQDAKNYLATMYIAGKRFYEHFGYIYHPSYKSLFCDNEIMDIAQRIGRYKYVDYQINVHLNPAYGHLKKDEMFIEQQGHWQEDEANYHARKARNFDL